MSSRRKAFLRTFLENRNRTKKDSSIKQIHLHGAESFICICIR